MSDDVEAGVKRKVKLEISFTEVIPRTIEVEAELDEDTIEDLVSGYGIGETKWRELVQKQYEKDTGECVEMLHDEVDHIEVTEQGGER